MKDAFKAWWTTLKAHEKNALLVLGAFAGGTLLLVSGIVIGQAMAGVV